jgi:hypothetical protein
MNDLQNSKFHEGIAMSAAKCNEVDTSTQGDVEASQYTSALAASIANLPGPVGRPNPYLPVRKSSETLQV